MASPAEHERSLADPCPLLVGVDLCATIVRVELKSVLKLCARDSLAAPVDELAMRDGSDQLAHAGAKSDPARAAVIQIAGACEPLNVRAKSFDRR